MSRPASPSANPFLAEGARICFSQRAVLRASALLVAILGCVLVLWWPRGPVASSLQPLAGPRTLTVVSVSLLAALAWLSARLGAEDHASSSFISMEGYVGLVAGDDARLRCRAVATVIRGKLAFGLVHTIFLLALGSPFVLAAVGVSGASFTTGLCILLVAGAAATGFRMLGLFLLTALPGHALVRDMVMLVAGAAGLAACTALLPAASPLSALLALAAAVDPPAVGWIPGPALPFYLVSVIMSLLVAVLFAAGASASLSAATKARNGTRDGSARSGAPEKNARSGAPEKDARSGAPEKDARSGAQV